MRLNRFYTERKNIRVDSSVKLSDYDANHVRKVLRLSKGDKITVFNGEKEFLAELILVTREFATARLLELIKEEDFSKPKVEITLFQSLLKAGKLEDILEKTTELGIDHVIPVVAEFSQSFYEHTTSKYERFNKIILAACQQSERLTIPELHQPISFQDVVNSKDNFDAVYFFTIPRKTIPESEGTQFLTKIPKEYSKVAIFIGPEGGFSPTEHKLAFDAGFEFVTFTDSILRSETAAITAVAVVKYLSSLTTTPPGATHLPPL